MLSIYESIRDHETSSHETETRTLRDRSKPRPTTMRPRPTKWSWDYFGLRETLASLVLPS